MYCAMTKQVALADRTYERLRRSRRPGESFSQAIERLLAGQAKDPLSFSKRVPKSPLDATAWRKQIEADRDSTRVDA